MIALGFGPGRIGTLVSMATDSSHRVVMALWNNSLISISILRDYWLETMRDGHKHLLIYLDFLPEPWGWFLFTVSFYGAKVSICILLEEIIR